MLPNTFLELRPLVFLMNLTCSIYVTYDHALAKFVANRAWYTKLRVLTLVTGTTILLYHSYPPLTTTEQVEYSKKDIASVVEFLLVSYLALFFCLNGYLVQDSFIEMVENFKEIDTHLLKFNGHFRDGILHKISPLVSIFMLVSDIAFLGLLFWFYGMEGVRKGTALKFLIVLLACGFCVPNVYFYLLIWEKFVVINNLIKESVAIELGNCAVCEGKDICYERICPEHKIKILISLHALSCSAANHWNDMFPGKSYMFMGYFEAANEFIFVISRIFSRVPTPFAAIFVNGVIAIIFTFATMVTITMITFTSMEANETAPILHRLYLKLEKASESLKSEIAAVSTNIFQKPFIYYILTYELNTNLVINMINSSFAFSAIVITFKIIPENM